MEVQLDLLVLVLLWAAAAGAWNISGGYAGQLSLGHAAYFGLGAYTSSLLFLAFHLSPWLGALAGAALAAGLGVCLGALTLRLRGPFFSLASIAFAEVVRIGAVNWRSLTRGSEGVFLPFQPTLAGFVFESRATYALVALGLTALVVVVTAWLERSKLGYWLAAFREDEEAARSLGVRTVRVSLAATALSSGLTALAGTLYAQYILFIEPDSVLSLNVSLQLPLIAIVGGAGTVWGPLLGSLLITPAGFLLRGWLGGSASGLHFVVYGLVVVLVVLFLPHGLLPQVRRLLDRAPARASA